MYHPDLPPLDDKKQQAWIKYLNKRLVDHRLKSAASAPSLQIQQHEPDVRDLTRQHEPIVRDRPSSSQTHRPNSSQTGYPLATGTAKHLRNGKSLGASATASATLIRPAQRAPLGAASRMPVRPKTATAVFAGGLPAGRKQRHFLLPKLDYTVTLPMGEPCASAGSTDCGLHGSKEPDGVAEQAEELDGVGELLDFGPTASYKSMAELIKELSQGIQKTKSDVPPPIHKMKSAHSRTAKAAQVLGKEASSDVAPKPKPKAPAKVQLVERARHKKGPTKEKKKGDLVASVDRALTGDLAEVGAVAPDGEIAQPDGALVSRSSAERAKLGKDIPVSRSSSKGGQPGKHTLASRSSSDGVQLVKASKEVSEPLQAAQFGHKQSESLHEKSSADVVTAQEVRRSITSSSSPLQHRSDSLPEQPQLSQRSGTMPLPPPTKEFEEVSQSSREPKRMTVAAFAFGLKDRSRSSTLRKTPQVDSSSESSSDGESSSSSGSSTPSNAVGREPVDVDLPGWFPFEVDKDILEDGGEDDEAAEEPAPTPAPPSVTCVGQGKVIVRWRFPKNCKRSLTWQLRLRSVNTDLNKNSLSSANWELVDLDAGRVHIGARESWKHRAIVMQPGLRVLGYCVHEGEKSKTPLFGTVVASYPGLTLVDFDPLIGTWDMTVKRQRVPQDWILLAATSKTISQVMTDMLEQETQVYHHSKAKGLWKLAKNKIYDSIVRRNRHCSIIWRYWVSAPDYKNMRLAADCAMKVDQLEGWSRPASRCGNAEAVGQIETRSELSGVTGDTFARMEQGFSKDSETDNTYTWWPVMLDRLQDCNALPAAKRLPTQLCCSSGVNVVLEPSPRIQVVPKQWFCDEFPDAERAMRNLCVGQYALAYYNTNANPSEEDLETLGEHPAPRCVGDVTLTRNGLNLAKTLAEKADADEEAEIESERAIRCVVLREFVSPALVVVKVHVASQKTTGKVPLANIYKYETPKKKGETTKKVYPYEWRILRNSSDGTFDVYARDRDENWKDATKLEVTGKLNYFKYPHTKAGLVTNAKIVKLHVRTTHYEVCFEEKVLKHREQVSLHSLSTSIQGEGFHCRNQQPEVVIHDLPDALENIEVSVGVATSPRAEVGAWSSPSIPCPVCFKNIPTCNPAGPFLTATKISVANAKWLLPAEPVASCFRFRLREVGSTDWCPVDSEGRFREMESALAWRSRLVPLTAGLWASVFGDYDCRKASTPGAAKIIKVPDTNIKTDDHTVEVQFQKPSTELIIGSMETLPLTCTEAPQFEKEFQTIPVDWIEAVWFADGDNFLKGSVMPSDGMNSYMPQKDVSFSVAKSSPSSNGTEFEIVGLDPLENAFVSKEFLDTATAISQGEDKYKASLQLASMNIHGLRAQQEYEVGVQALTTRGWTEWSNQRFRMPLLGQKQEKLVDVKRQDVFYKDPLLTRAFYKEYRKCWNSLEENLDEERFQKLKAVLDSNDKESEKKQRASLRGRHDDGKSRHLVDMDGPIRSKAPLEDIRKMLESLVNRRADLNHRDQVTGRTPLTYACEYVAPFVKNGVVEILLDLKAEVNSMNDHRETGLALAAGHGNTRVVKALLDHGADPNVLSTSGKTAYLAAGADRGGPPLGKRELEDREKTRELLRAGRVDWDEFVAKMKEASDAVEKSKVFLELAFPGDPKGETVFSQLPDGSKRISGHDRLRLFEQIAEAKESSEEAWKQRGEWCGHELLLPAMWMAGMQEIKNKTCAVFTRYMLFSGVMRFVKKEAHQMATKILDHYAVILKEMRGELKILRTLTEAGQQFVNLAAKENREKFNGHVLHQWHAHGDLPWLTENNVVVAFEALVHSGAVEDLGDFCSWIGDLNARMYACEPESTRHHAAWDDRLPWFFWGDAYTRYLLGEAARTASVFHDIVYALIKKVGTVTYKEAPNKNYARVAKKQIEYATFGLLVLHVAADHMNGCFHRVFRADLNHKEGTRECKHVNSETGALLIIGAFDDEDRLHAVDLAIDKAKEERSLKAASAGTEDTPLVSETEHRPIVVIMEHPRGAEIDVDALRQRFQERGADATVLLKGPLEVWNAEETLNSALDQVYAGWEKPTRRKYTTEKLAMLFETRKNKSKFKHDLMSAGGLLDMVRGSIECTTEEEIATIYKLALDLTFANDHAEVVRVKNGFHSPVVGGYCDLKLFLQVAHEAGEIRVCHICELQVHLKQFLDRKKYTHMPYVIDRGDFDED